MHLLAESAFTLLPHEPVTRSIAVDAATADASALGRAMQPVAMARTAARLWRGLAERHPSWVGPKGITTKELSARADALEAAVAAAGSRSGTPTKAEALSSDEQSHWIHVIRFHEVLEEEGAAGACRHGRAALEVQKNPAFEAVFASHCAGSGP